MIPQKIGRYEISSELGRGGMATVYYAHDPRFKRDVAVKVLPREFLHDPTFRARFEREAQIIASLEHPAIVPVYDFGEEDGQLYFVMRFMAGGSLAGRLNSGSLSLAEAARLFARLAPALDEAHAKGVVHRDLKPGNILFDQYHNPYLSDFGIAKLSEASAIFTGTAAVIGTPAYMSPEQARGDPDLDRRADVYALGAILFEALTGSAPYHAATPMGVAIKHISEPVPPILKLKPDLPADCGALIQRAMAKSPDQRFATAGEMARALEAVARGEPIPPPNDLEKTVALPPESGIAFPTQSAERRRRILFWGGIAGGLIALCLLLTLLTGSGLSAFNRLPTAASTFTEAPPPSPNSATTSTPAPGATGALERSATPTHEMMLTPTTSRTPSRTPLTGKTPGATPFNTPTKAIVAPPTNPPPTAAGATASRPTNTPPSSGNTLAPSNTPKPTDTRPPPPTDTPTNPPPPPTPTRTPVPPPPTDTPVPTPVPPPTATPDTQGPNISNLNANPVILTTGCSVTFSADISDPSGVASAKVDWRGSGGQSGLASMSGPPGGGMWSVTTNVSAPLLGHVDWTVTASDSSSFGNLSQSGGPQITASLPCP